MTIYEMREAERRWETIKNAKRRRNGGETPLTMDDLIGLEDWQTAPGVPFTAGEAREWLRFGAKLRERFPGEATLDDVVERLLEAERADQKIREFLSTENERKQRANSFTDAFGNRRRSIWGDAPRELPSTRTNAEPPRWTPERKIWG